jgi:hypothetical protein
MLGQEVLHSSLEKTGRRVEPRPNLVLQACVDARACSMQQNARAETHAIDQKQL